MAISDREFERRRAAARERIARRGSGDTKARQSRTRGSDRDAYASIPEVDKNRSWWDSATEWWDGLDLDQGIFENDEEQERERRVREGRATRPIRQITENPNISPQQKQAAIKQLRDKGQSRGITDWLMSGGPIGDFLDIDPDQNMAEWFEENPDFYAEIMQQAEDAERGGRGGSGNRNQEQLQSFFDDMLKDVVKQSDDRRGQIKDLEGLATDARDKSLGEYNEFKDLFKSRLGMGDTYLDKQIEQAEDYKNSPSVVDAMLQDAFQRQQGQLTSAYAGRTGGGYLEDFNQNRELMNQKIRDAGVPQRLAEQQQKQQTLLNVLGGAAQSKYGTAQNLPFDLIGRRQSIESLPYAAQTDILNFFNQDDNRRQNLLGNLFAWNRGEQDFSNKLSQQGFQNYLARQGNLRADKADYRQDIDRRDARNKEAIGIGTDVGKSFLGV